MPTLQDRLEQLIFLQAANIGAANPPVNNHDRVQWARDLVTDIQRERCLSSQSPLGPNGFPRSVLDERNALVEADKERKLAEARALIKSHEDAEARKRIA